MYLQNMCNKYTDKCVVDKYIDRFPSYLNEKYTLKDSQTLHFYELFMYKDEKAHF